MKIRKKIKIAGIISSNSFVSHVSTLAKKFNLSGSIKDNHDSTSIEIEGDNASILGFMSSFRYKPKGLSRVVEFDCMDIPVLEEKEEFLIQKDLKNVFSSGYIPKDLCVCDDCLKDLFDKNSKRYYYPFISCEKCGSKYSSLKELPYTRENSVIGNFELCEQCENELENGHIAYNFSNCPECGPQIWLKLKKLEIFDRFRVFRTARRILHKKGVLLIKSNNCFYLCSNAFSKRTVARIRDIKNRKDKPLTVMASNIKEIEKFAYLNEDEKRLLLSPERPVVMLKLRKNNYLAPNIVNGFDKIGVMLPFSPIHYLLFAESKLSVLVMSSANTGGNAVETDNEKAETRFKGLVDGMMFHNLDIVNGSDDSVVTFINGQKYFLRVGRGFAPKEIQLCNITNSSSILACGGYNNSAISIITPDGTLKTTPYIGDLDNSNVFELYKKNILSFTNLLNIDPEQVACDSDPDYFSTKYAKSLGIPCHQLQHTFAHLLSCLADNELSLKTPVIGVIFDNCSLGEDQTIWGGEFLISKDLEYKRINNIPVFKMIDMQGKENQIYKLGFSLLKRAGIPYENAVYNKLKITLEEQKSLENAMNFSRIKSPLTTSASKLFEGIAAILEIAKTSSYEDQAVLQLEALADKSCMEKYSLKDYSIKCLNELIQEIVKDINKKTTTARILAKFHNTLAYMIAQTCLNISQSSKINKVVLSGSVWMNLLLLERTVAELEKINLIPITHKNISTSDESLSVGQAAYLAYKQQKTKDSKPNSDFSSTNIF